MFVRNFINKLGKEGQREQVNWLFLSLDLDSRVIDYDFF